MSGHLFCGWVFRLAATLLVAQGAAVPASAEHVPLRITVVFNNVPQVPGLAASWGFSCFVEGPGGNILFDTGGDGRILTGNMRKLGLDPKRVDAVFLSHMHGDHTGGLDAILGERSGVPVIVPAEFPQTFKDWIAGRGGVVKAVAAGDTVAKGVYTTGALPDGIAEQAMILETESGLVVITGCAHPGIDRIAAAAARLRGKKITLLMGGFHLGGTSRAEILKIIARLETLGVEKVAPSHCTGEAATALFRQAWGSRFLEGGLGATFLIPDPGAHISADRTS